MKTKQTTDANFLPITKTKKTKQKSLRPMKSMVAIRSLKPKTLIANLTKHDVDTLS